MNGNLTSSLKGTNIAYYRLVSFCEKEFLSWFWHFSRCLVAFGLNALYNRQQIGGAWSPWDSSNARALIDFSIEQGIQIEAWELGNNQLLC
jgi:hypothetical protein